jgi:hypothetical protein
MTKFTLTLAATLLAGTTLTSVANAGGIRVGFGFPLGSFIAHSNQSYSDDSYRRHNNRRNFARRTYQAEAAPVRKVKRPRKTVVAAKPITAPVVKTAKLEDKLVSDPATTTEIAKTNDATTASVTPAKSETTTAATSETPKTETKTETPAKTETVATVEKTPVAKVKQICRRYSAAIAGLIDVPCDE